MKNNNKKVFVPDDERNNKSRIELNNYTHIRTYHGCRPVDLESYFVKGINAYHSKELLQIAADTFGLSINSLMKYDSESKPFISNQVYFSLFKQELLGESGHYLCYGSEYLLGIAVQLDKGVHGEFQKILSNIGIPTIFICDLPLNILSQQQKDLISNHYEPYNNSNFSCWISDSLQPEYIVGHEHPSNIFNPIQRNMYKNKQISCNWCRSTS